MSCCVEGEHIDREESEAHITNIEKQFKIFQEYVGNAIQTGTKKIKEKFGNRKNNKITIDDIDISCHPVIIEHSNESKELRQRLDTLERQLSRFIDNFENMEVATNSRFNNVNQKIEEHSTLRRDFSDIRKEIGNLQSIIDMEVMERLDNIETSMYETKSGVNYLMENVDVNNLKSLVENSQEMFGEINGLKESTKNLEKCLEEHKAKMDDSIICLD